MATTLTREEQCAIYRARLAEADTALHNLMLGKGVQSIRYGEKETRFTRANINELQKYHAWLTDLVCGCDGGDCNRNIRRAIAFIPI